MSKALITSGGGAKGAFTIGALIGLQKLGHFPFDVISGTSTGSFIAALLAAGEIETLRAQYLNVRPNDILSKQNIIANILNKKAFLFDTHPLLSLIKLHVTQSVFDRIMGPGAPILCITAVSLQTGLSTVFSNRRLQRPPDNSYKVKQFESLQEMVSALLASGSQAGFTPPVVIGNEQFVDGGHRDVIPTQIVIDLGVENVFVLSNNPSTQFIAEEKLQDLLSVVLRTIGIFVQDVRENDFRRLAEFLTTKGKKPILIEPANDLDEENPTGLRFNPSAMLGWMLHGEQQAFLLAGRPGAIV